jgi:predicted nuclease with TOPRIM domain
LEGRVKELEGEVKKLEEEVKKLSGTNQKLRERLGTLSEAQESYLSTIG